MLNTCIVAGRLTANPELKHTPNNVAVATFTVAVDRDFKDRDGNRATDFIPVVAWRNTAEFASRYLEKGRLVMVSGRIQVRNYTDNNNVKHYITEIIADNLYFADSKRPEQRENQFAPADDVNTPFDDVDDGLPF